MEPPTTVTKALADRPVAGATCLEAGAGVGNGTVGFLDADADHVFAISNDHDHVAAVGDRVPEAERDRTTLMHGDLRSIPLPDSSVDIVLAHALVGVLAPADLEPILEELTRVARPGAHLVVDDYAPLPPDSPVRRLFAIENAASEIATGRAALYFYPPGLLRRLCAGYGWAFDRERTLLDPVPWSAGLLDEHVDVVRDHADSQPGELGQELARVAERIRDETGSADVGRMYSLAMELPGN